MGCDNASMPQDKEKSNDGQNSCSNENETDKNEKLRSFLAECECSNDNWKSNKYLSAHNTTLSPSNIIDDEGDEEDDEEEKISIDHMTKDYASFRSALLDLIPVKTPKWVDRSEADMGIMLLELFSYVADELSYLQDRVANEAFLSTAKQRSSVKGHLALIDYYLQDGLSADVFIKIKANKPALIQAGFQLSTDETEKNPIVFETIVDHHIDPLHNEMTLLNTFIDDITGQPCAIIENRFAKLQKGQYILFENSKTENAEIVRLSKGPTFVGSDTKITWSIEEKLKFHYELKSDKICANITRANQGKTLNSEILKQKDQITNQFSFRIKNGPITYISDGCGDTSLPHAQSTIKVWVDGQSWDLTNNLLECGPFDQKFSVSVDNGGYATVNFGDGVFGTMPSSHSLIEAQYRFGTGSIGNVGRNTLRKFDLSANSPSIVSCIESITNPLPAFGGVDPESIDEAKIAGPKSIQIQHRAVVLEDYERLVMLKFPTYVSRAKARFVYNGSFNIVFVSIAVKGGIRVNSGLTLSMLLHDVKKYLESVKMIGYKIKVDSAKYVPIEIMMTVFIKQGFDSEGIKERVRLMFGNKDNPDGSSGFFHPSNFGFGDFVYVSKVYETLKKIPEVSYGVISVFKRMNPSFGYLENDVDKNTFSSRTILKKQDKESEKNLKQGYISVDENEIIRLDNYSAYRPKNGVLILRFLKEQTRSDAKELSIGEWM